MMPENSLTRHEKSTAKSLKEFPVPFCHTLELTHDRVKCDFCLAANRDL